MGRFIFKRLLHMIPLLLGVSLLTFLLMSLAPGNYFTTLSQNPQVSQETIHGCRRSSISTAPGMSNISTG